MTAPRSTENGVNLYRVWCVVYDSDTPSMDGHRNPVRMHEVRSLEAVQTALRIVEERSVRAPKRNLRIETRLVSDYEVFSPDQAACPEVLADRDGNCTACGKPILSPGKPSDQ